MLDIAEMQFIKIADYLIKLVMTVKECFNKYSIPQTLPESNVILDLIPPGAFIEALKTELGLPELSDLEIACLMRVLAKPELGNAIILNEFALIMENFGVPLVEDDEADDKPDYNLNNVDDEGI